MTNHILEISDLAFSYHNSKRERPVLDGLNFNMARGDILGLLGLNGAGKTTLVSLIMGLLSPASGSIVVSGGPARPGHTSVRLVPQEFAFYENLSPLENLRYFASVSNIRNNETANKQRGNTHENLIWETLDKCHLRDLAHTRSRKFSGGEKRRLNLAIALLNPGELLILDEPTASVDPHSRALILQIVRELNKAGTSIIYTTHLLGEVQEVCSHIALLHHGQLKAQGTVEKLLVEEHSIESLFMKLTTEQFMES